MSVLAGAKGPLFQDLQTTLFCNFHLISSDISKYMLGKVTFSAGFTGKTKGGKVLLRAAIASEVNIKRESSFVRIMIIYETLSLLWWYEQKIGKK